jgi:sugar (pentulose or hexulose) kinase
MIVEKDREESADVYYLTLDIGSSFIKSAVFDIVQLKMFGEAKWNTPGKMPSKLSGRYEVDAESILRSVVQAIEAQLKRFPGIRGIVLATQMHGFVLTDLAGKPVTPYISWQDERCLEPLPGSTETCLSRLQTTLPQQLLQYAGVPLKPGLALCNLYHWLAGQGVSLDRGSQLRFCTLGSYINSGLTGAYATHITNAAATGFVDIVKGEWNKELIQAVGGDSLIFPELRGEFEPVGSYRSGKLVIPVFPDIGDQQASVLGSLSTAESELVVTIGTAGLLSKIDDQFRFGPYEIRPYFSGSFLYTVTRIPGGRNLDVLVRFIRDIGRSVFAAELSEDALWAQLLQLAEESGKSVHAGTPGNVGDDPKLQVNLGFFPQQQGVDRGSIEQIDADNLHPGSLICAALDSLAEVYDSQIDKLYPDRSRLKRLVFTGGVAVKAGLLAKLIAGRAGCQGDFTPLPCESLSGLLRIALVCAGRCRDLEEARRLLRAHPLAHSAMLPASY